MSVASPVEQPPMRVLVVIPGAPEDNSMTFSRRQARALSMRPDAVVETWFFRSRTSLVALLRARQAFQGTIERFVPDVVHVHYGTITAFFTVLFSPVPVVVTYHGSDLNRTPGDGLLRDLFGRTLSQFAALGAAGIICVSDGLRQRLWWRRKEVEVIPMGVELDRYVPIPREEARRELGWPDRPLKIIFNSRDAAVKRLDIARAVEAQVRALGVDAELEVLRGGITQERMPILLSAADALLLCSDSEGSPTMVKEAMACNLPVVTNDVGDVRERLAGVSPGAIVPRDPERMADALREVLRDRRRSNGRASALRNGVDAASLDARTFDLLRMNSRPRSGTLRTGMTGRTMGLLAAALAFALPLWPAVLPVLVFLLLCCSVRARLVRQAAPGRSGMGSPLFWSAMLYAAYLIGLLWTVNMDFAGLDLGIKSSLALFALLPLIGVPTFSGDLAKRAFILSNVIAVLCCLVRALFRAMDQVVHLQPNETVSGYTLSVPFFASGFSAFLHPTYMAMYLTFAFILLVQRPLTATTDVRWRAVQVFLLVLGVVLCASKAGWIILLLTIGGMLAGGRYERHMRRTIAWGLAAAMIGGAALYFTTDYVQERVGQVVDTFRKDDLDPQASNSTDDRRLVWTAAMALLEEHPWTGAGTGDVKDALLQAYAERGYAEPLRKKLNAHDQYLNTGVALGLGGLFVLVAMVVVPTLFAIRRRNILLVHFLLLNALNWTVESMLEVQAGTIFFAFFAWLLTLEETRSSQRPMARTT